MSVEMIFVVGVAAHAVVGLLIYLRDGHDDEEVGGRG